MSDEEVPVPSGKERRSSGRRDYDDLAEKVGLYTENTEKRLSRFFKGAIIALSIIGLATTGALVGFGIVLDAQQNTADQLEKLVDSNQKFAKDIQDQRRESIITGCRTQNARNEATKEALTSGSDQDIRNAPTEEAKDEVRRRRDVTLALIDALAPADNCEEAAKRAVKPPTDG